jgi:hypothetical protein
MTPTATIANAIFEGTTSDHYDLAAFARADEAPAGSECTIITRCHTTVVDADPSFTRDLLGQLDLTTAARRMLEALDAGDRLVLAPTRLPSTAGRPSIGMIWRLGGPRPVSHAAPRDFASFDEPCHVKARWDIGVEPRTDAPCLLSVQTELTATDDDARARILDAWGIVEPLASAFVHRIARTIKDAAEHDEEWT